MNIFYRDTNAKTNTLHRKVKHALITHSIDANYRFLAVSKYSRNIQSFFYIQYQSNPTNWKVNPNLTMGLLLGFT